MRETFVDEATIDARSGSGGNGCVAFRREKYVPKGGPNGGDGGRGGDVVAIADAGKRTLHHLRFRRRQFAQDGQSGGGAQCTGADGATCELRLPIGTQLFDADDGTLLADLATDGARAVLLVGGRGGKGNEHFKGPSRQAPDFAQPGEPGRQRRLRLELKLLADVGLLGMPNVGKSSLIASISAARPKIANYPFTTLVPNLGVVAYRDAEPFVVADVPGLVPGASRGLGLGAQFLRHIERVRVLVHMVTAETGLDDRSPLADVQAINHELVTHRAALADVPQILVLNQCDRPEVEAATEEVAAYARAHDLPFFAISAASGAGVQPLVAALVQLLARIPATPPAPSAPPLVPLEAPVDPLAAGAESGRFGHAPTYDAAFDAPYA